MEQTKPVRIRADIHQELKVLAVSEQLSMSDMIKKLITEYTKEK